jgi:hypothetical protein
MRIMRRRDLGLLGARLAGAAACAWLLAGCPGAVVMSPEEIQKHGVVMVRAPAEKAFRACVEALKQIGYEIEIEAPDKGLIVTKRKGLPDLSMAMNAAYSKQYTLEIHAAGGASKVTATPAIFENDTDVSAKKRVWDLEGPLGERELWKQLFAKIEQLL